MAHIDMAYMVYGLHRPLYGLYRRGPIGVWPRSIFVWPTSTWPKWFMAQIVVPRLRAVDDELGCLLTML